MSKEIEALEQAVLDAKKRLLDAKKQQPAKLLDKDYEFTRPDGSRVRLSDLFGGKSDLIVVHNMGRKCSYCTMWADGFIGLSKHLKDRAGFVLVSPDEPDVLREFATSRGWNFPCVSSHGTTFHQDVWKLDADDGTPWPGTTTYRKRPDGRIEQIAGAGFGPGDDFCAVWSFLDLLADGPNDWRPKYAY